MKNVTLADRCVVDANGFYKIFVTVQTEQSEDETSLETVLGYKLKQGESLIDTLPPTRKAHAGGAGFVKPCWDEGAAAWVEGASAEELAAWEAEHPAPEVPEPQPSLEARVNELAEALDMILSGVTE